jgi:hypothetical protein
MRKYTLLAALLLCATQLFAQGEFIIEIDPTTAAFTKKGGAIQGIGWVVPGSRAYDETNGRMIFEGGNPTPHHLYGVDLANCSIVENHSV